MMPDRSSIPVFVTRPAHQAAGQIEAVSKRGFAPVAAPCLVLKIERGPPLRLDDVTGFAVTSANGVLALASRTGERDLPVYAVGAATAAEARAQGFAHVEVAEGDGASLARLIGQRVTPRSKRILHASGTESAFDLVWALGEYEILAELKELYSMPVAAHLPAAALAVLDAKQPSFALLMSARTVQAFGDLVAAAGRAEALRFVTALCLSPAIAVAAGAYPFRRVAVAAGMTQEALLDLLEAESGRV